MSVTFPNVPLAAGVPAVGRVLGQVTAPIVALAADVASVRSLFQGPQWGLFKDGAPIIASGSVVGMEYRKGFRVASHPIEQGGFSSYNKVEEPFDSHIQIAIDGTTLLGSLIGTLDVFSAALGGQTSGNANRQAVLATLNAAVKSLDLLQVVTPEFTYANANLVRYEYGRRAHSGGVSMIVVDLFVQEIRVVAPLGFANTENAEGADPVNQGAPQPQTPTPAQTPPTPASVPKPPAEVIQSPAPQMIDT
ncbi:MAG: hypothetical protein ACRYGG_13160 [Janthinobacterium lividum]